MPGIEPTETERICIEPSASRRRGAEVFANQSDSHAMPEADDLEDYEAETDVDSLELYAGDDEEPEEVDAELPVASDEDDEDGPESSLDELLARRGSTPARPRRPHPTPPAALRRLPRALRRRRRRARGSPHRSRLRSPRGRRLPAWRGNQTGWRTPQLLSFDSRWVRYKCVQFQLVRFQAYRLPS